MEEEQGKKKESECVSVVVRCRPMNRKENDEKRTSIIDIDIAARQVSIKNPADPDEVPKSFTYDGAYDEATQQRVFYEESCFGIIESVLEGFNGTIFAYGQTGCGKSFTMQGPTQNPTPEMRGVIPNSFSHIFESVKASTDVEYLIRCSYLEIYNEEVKDLLSSQKPAVKCELKEDPQRGVFVKGLTDVVVETEDQLMAMLDKGLSVRTTASTQMNAESSRSHSIFSVVVEMITKDLMSGKDMIRAGKLNLVDLAGSERQKKTGATGNLLKEGAKINLSLSALGNVISALSEGSKGKHIPYRDSKLTRLLQDSLGGNTKTLMVAAISPADYNFDETMSTLRYANRAKNIKNKPKINEDPKDTMLREFKEEIERLRKLLSDKAEGINIGTNELLESGVLGSSGGRLPRPKKIREVEEEEDEEEEEEEIVVKKKKIKKVKRAAVEEEDEDDIEDSLSRKQTPSNSLDKSGNTLEYSYERKGMEEFSNAVLEERDAVSEQLRLKESEIDQERLLRKELSERLKELQNKFVGHNELQIQQEKDQKIGAIAASNPITQAEEAEKEEAKKQFKERRLKAKKKREAKQLEESALVVMERQAMEDELEELKLAAVAEGEEKVNDIIEKRMSKMKKKYDKKIREMRADLVDANEEFEYQRQNLLDSLKEQEKDTSLFETVCRSLLDTREFKRMLAKSKWLEDEEEWLIPTLRIKSVDYNSGNNFPDIHRDMNSLSNNSSHTNIVALGGGGGVAGMGGNMHGGSPRSSTESLLYPAIKNKKASPRVTGPIPPQSSSSSHNNNQLEKINKEPNLLLSLPPAGSSSSVSLPNLPSARMRDKSPAGEATHRNSFGLGIEEGGNTARSRKADRPDRPVSLGLKQPISAYGNNDPNMNMYENGMENGNISTTVDDSQLQAKRKRKSKKKKANNKSANNNNGPGRGFEGSACVDEWGFAIDGGHKEPEYSDDEDFEGDIDEPEERDGRGDRGGGGNGGIGGGIGFEPKPYRESREFNGGNHSMPPIDNHRNSNGKVQTSGSIGGGLPQIR